MLKGALIGSFILFLALSAPAAGSEPAGIPAFHEGLARAWDELARDIGEWGGRWREHFGARRSREARPLITIMLRHRDQLELSSEQVSRLEHLRREFEREAIRAEADQRIAEVDLAGFLEAEAVDMGKVEAKVREIETLRADLRLARIRAIEKGKQLLSAEQRKKLEEIVTEPRLSRLGRKPPR